MKILLNEKTKQEKIMNEAQKKRNLFGLGLTSLIAACSATDSATDNTAEDEVAGIGTIPQTALTATPLAAVATATGAAINPYKENSAGQLMGRVTGKQDLVVNLISNDERVDGSGSFLIVFRNGDHTDIIPSDYSVTTRQGLVPDNKYSLVVASGKFGDVEGTVERGAVYIVWNITAGEGQADAKNTGDSATTVPKHLKVAGVAGDTISAFTPTFYQIGGVKTAGNEPADQADMVFGSTKGYNILWDVTKHAITSDAGATNLTLGTSPGILQVQGTGTAAPEFAKINDNDDYDMVVTDATTTYILWDVANYYDATANVEVNLATPDADGAVATHGLLKITGTGTAVPEFIKVNNNEDYDMIVQGSGIAYILWDVAEYHDANANAKVEVNLATPAAEGVAATNGLLTITGLRGSIDTAEITNEGAPAETGYIDVDGDGVNDLVFTQSIGASTNTYILFGEKVADMNGGKANSHTVNLATVASGDFYNKAGTKIEGATAGFFHFDLDGTGEEVQNVGYRFDSATEISITTVKERYEAAINPPAVDGALSEEAYWDIA